VPPAPAAQALSDAAIGTTDGRSLRSSMQVPPRAVAVVDVHVRRHHRQSGDGRPRVSSLMTWTIFIGKFRRNSSSRSAGCVARSTRSPKARSIAEARVALGAKASILSNFLATALREARLSAGISSDSGIKERAASSFAEITRAEARRMRLAWAAGDHRCDLAVRRPFGTVWAS